MLQDGMFSGQLRWLRVPSFVGQFAHIKEQNGNASNYYDKFWWCSALPYGWSGFCTDKAKLQPPTTSPQL
jgi:hypothetical protein